MLVSLVTTHAAEKTVEVVKPAPVAPPEQLQKGTPRLTKPAVPRLSTRSTSGSCQAGDCCAVEGSDSVSGSPAADYKPIITSNTSAENTAVVPATPPPAKR